MPGSNYPSSKYSRSANGTRRRVNQSTLSKRRKSVIPRSIGAPLTQVMQTTMRYHTIYSPSFATNTYQQYSFGANQLWDVELDSLGGHQPLYFDQFAAMYNHWCVKSSRIRCEFGDTSTAIMYLGVGVFDTTTYPTTGPGLAELPSTKGFLHSRGNGKYFIANSYSALKMFGLSDTALMADVNHRGSSSANSSELAVFGTLMADPLYARTYTGLTISVTIEFDVLWHELKNVPYS